MNLSEFFPNLIDRKITLSDLGISARVFSNWKNEGVVDYISLLEKDELNSKGEKKKRKWVYLNAFDAIWLLIVKDLRRCNLDLKTIVALKDFLTGMEFDESLLDELSDEDLRNHFIALVDPELLSQIDVSVLKKQFFISARENLEGDNKMFLTKLAELMLSVLVFKQRPSIVITDLEGEKSFQILNKEGHIEAFGIEDFYDVIMSQFSNLYFINIPIINAFTKLFADHRLEKYCNYYELFSKSEKEILHALRKDDFKEIIIYKESNEKYIITTTNSIELKNQQAVELRKILGLKQYEKAEVIYRNDKHLVVHNTTKTSIEK